ncbi:hypothetical protein [Hymenobacter convexus]|uniref:hypothetical protein n=1 Tax=Hymenobacter sp. CA1UV-4 TaxID=3063782 RepID=UPI0027140155|nr:hypothetical protein [Hymenobacter sp. CA1UV-4]MDO7850018.1 hypothetical protein [Hymenobacter sp. CA1UV-4]
MAHGQGFERGLVVTTAGDTLRGEIENRFWQAPPENVVFRPAPQASRRTFDKAQLRAFRLEKGRYFRAEVVPLDRAARSRTASLLGKLEFDQRPELLLAEVLVEGPVTLLQAVVDDVTHYFVQRPGQPFLELTERKYLVDKNGQALVVDANNYKSQLTIYFGECPAAVAAAGKASFLAKDLIAVAQAFARNCSATQQAASTTAVLKPPHFIAFNGGLLAGGSYNRLSFDNPKAGIESPLFNDLRLDGKWHPSMGLYLDVLLPARRWMVHTELTYSTYGQAATQTAGVLAYQWSGSQINGRFGARHVFNRNAD